jgi:hypothetical protein
MPQTPSPATQPERKIDLGDSADWGEDVPPLVTDCIKKKGHRLRITRPETSYLEYRCDKCNFFYRVGC